jgi:hypothetical protein
MKDEMPTEGSRPQALQDGDLRANTLACEMADEWCAHRAKLTGLPGVSVWMYGALDRLEAITRESPLRKVRP